jgi:SAM-dependent methyltransferase
MPFEELKQRQSVVWGTGPYQNITETIPDIHERVIARLDPQPGVKWLDLACGTGAVAELAATRGADVTGVDLAPGLIETAKERAGERGLDIDYRVGDCEDLQFEDGSFDAISSTCGVMFAPDHQATANELARVVKAGGRIALGNWTPHEKGMAAIFGLMRPFMPAPPEGAGSPFAWGDEQHVRELLGDSFDLEFEPGVSPVEFVNGESYWELFSSSYGPTRTLAEGLDDERREELHRSWVDFADGELAENGGVNHKREWVLVYGTRR